MWAGIVARIDQARGANRLPNLDSLPNTYWPYSADAGDFDDITSGSSPRTTSDPCVSNGSCVAQVGFDEVTGRGSPLVQNLVSDLANRANLDIEPIGGVATSAPSVASWFAGRLDLFARGPDGSLWHWWFASGGWSGPQSLGGQIVGAPAAVSWGSNRIDVLVRGTNNALYHKWFDGSNWSDFENLGGGLTDAPAVSSWAENRLDVFVRGNDNALYHKWWDGARWNGFENQGGILTAGPGAVSWGGNRIDVFVRGTDSGLWHKWWDGSAWSGWQALGGALDPGAAPAPASTTFGSLDVYVLGSGGDFQHIVWAGSWIGFLSGHPGAWRFGPGTASQPTVGDVEVFTVDGSGVVWHTAGSSGDL
jgi:hypothetical protein